jgi:hypothetical protein
MHAFVARRVAATPVALPQHPSRCRNTRRVAATPVALPQHLFN